MCGGGGGGVWQGHAWWGACMAEGAHVAGGSDMHGRGHAWQGVCMAVGGWHACPQQIL